MPDSVGKRRGGRPRKEADPAYPKRLNTQLEADNGIPEPSAVDGSNDDDPIAAEASGASSERIIVSAGEKEIISADDTEEAPDNPVGNDTPTYYCQHCKMPLIEGQARCSGCLRRLAW